MPITRTPMIDDDGTGTTGTIINNAWKQEFYNQIDGYVGGQWINIPHSAVTFSATTGAWTVLAGQMNTFRYAIVSKIAFFHLGIAASSNSASTVRLGLTLPGGIPLSIGPVSAPALSYYHQGGPGHGYVEIGPGDPTMNFLRDILGTPWTATTTGLYLDAQWFYAIP